MHKGTKVALAVLAIALAFVIWFGVSVYSQIPDTPQLAVKAFYERDVAEDQIMDPLILRGPTVIPLLERDLSDPQMPRRRYAIAALGNIESTSALPILERLARDEAEIDYIRCDALAAIAMISSQEALRVTTTVHAKQLQCFSDIAEHLRGDYAEWLKSSAPRRTYMQALMGRHS